jgi:glycosyltransferase involved in cell wall biosynthesis
MDLMVSPSTSESFGIGMLEAMAAGVPLVAVAGTGLTELLPAGRAAVLVPSADPEALAAGAGLLIRDPELRHRLSVEARRQVLDRFSADAMVEDLTSKLESLSLGSSAA